MLSSTAPAPALPGIDAGRSSPDRAAEDEDEDTAGIPAGVRDGGSSDEADSTVMPEDSNIESNDRLMVGTECTTGGTGTGTGATGIKLESSIAAREETASAVVVSSKEALRLLSVTSPSSTSCRSWGGNEKYTSLSKPAIK